MKSLIVALYAIGLLMLPHDAIASSYDSSSLEVEVRLRINGQADIAQTLTLRSPERLDWKILTDAKGLEVQADGVVLSDRELTRKVRDGVTTINSTHLATVWQLRYRADTILIRASQQDRMYLKILNAPGIYLESARVVLHLPQVPTEEGLFGNLYAIRGVGSSRTELTSPGELTYQSEKLGPEVILTANANWPKSVLHLGWMAEIRLFLVNLDVIPWLVLGLLLPLTALTILRRIGQRDKFAAPKVQKVSNRLPSDLSPLLIGVLVNKKIYPAVIVAMLIDLCQRGYLVIVKKGGEYYLAQRRVADGGLAAWERDLIAEIFPSLNEKVSREEIVGAGRQVLYSPKIRQTFIQIYEVITNRNFFTENPHWTRVKYKLVALACYYLGAVSLIWVALTGSSPLLLIPLAGTIMVSYLIIRLTPRLVAYTPAGIATRDEWLSFANFLKLSEPLPPLAARDKTFERYLPYAIALNCPKEWGERFDQGSSAIITPDWFMGYGMSSSSTSKFVAEIVGFTESVSRLIAGLRGPMVR